MNIVGVSAFYHDSAVCILQNGKVVAAASEERFSRIKNDPNAPVQAFRFCMEKARIDITEIDALAYYENPIKKLSRQLYCGPKIVGNNPTRLDPHLPEFNLRTLLGYEGPIHVFDHHQSHAASSFYFSGMKDAAILTVDGVGEWATTTYGKGLGEELELFEEVEFPHSLGLLYATITSFLGFRVNSGEYKVMGLAPYGKPTYVDEIKELVTNLNDGQYRLNLDYFDFINGPLMYRDTLSELLGLKPRVPESNIEDHHKNLAHSLQVVLEEILMQKVHYLHEKAPSENLCMAGGVALNCVANGKILREGPFKNLFIQPAAGDAGTALGAAALAHYKCRKDHTPVSKLTHVYLGSNSSNEEIAQVLEATRLPFKDFRNNQKALIEDAANRLFKKEIIGWFQGASEFGPRALGSRSILANPCDPTIRDRLNAMVKKREAFRPFAPSVLESEAARYFDLQNPSPYMLQICQVTSDEQMPGITHVNGSARPQTVNETQNPKYAALIARFGELSGHPVIVNTSFNVRGEPIVNTPIDALVCMAGASLDALFIGDFMIGREQIPEFWSKILPYWERVRRSAFSRNSSAISEHLYTFV